MTTTSKQFLASGLSYVRRHMKHATLSDNMALDTLEIMLGNAATDLEFYTTLRNYATAIINVLRDK